MNLWEILQVEHLVEYILDNCSYEDIDDLIEKIGVDADWFNTFLPQEDEE